MGNLTPDELSKIPEKSRWLYEDSGHIKVACRLCGGVWRFPLAYESEFKKNPSWECPYCVRGIRTWGRGPV